MNFLAHAFLSFELPDILTGNMISDFVKGKQKFNYPAGVQRGIQLHRDIDEFTDRHQATRQASGYFKSNYRLYSGAFVDVLYDHFLANDEKIFVNEKALSEFSRATYGMLEKNSDLLPLNFKALLPYMKKQDWLYGYRLKEGIARSFAGLVRRAAYLSESDTAFDIFNENYKALSDCYDEFFPALEAYSIHRFAELNNS